MLKFLIPLCLFLFILEITKIRLRCSVRQGGCGGWAFGGWGGGKDFHQILLILYKYEISSY
jgi:hypothetical protein